MWLLLKLIIYYCFCWWVLYFYHAKMCMTSLWYEMKMQRKYSVVHTGTNSSSSVEGNTAIFLTNSFYIYGKMMQYLSHKRITTQWLQICCCWISHALCIKACFTNQATKRQTKEKNKLNRNNIVKNLGWTEASDATGVQWCSLSCGIVTFTKTAPSNYRLYITPQPWSCSADQPSVNPL